MHFEKIMNTLYSFAAGVVIFGAWAKLEHKPYGSIALTVGLLTETGIFILYGLMEWSKTPAKEDQPATSNNQSLNPEQTQQLTSSLQQTQQLTSTLQQTNRILNKVFRAE